MGAIVAAVTGIANAAYALGIGVDDSEGLPAGALLLSLLLFVTAWGMWRARYWAVLGMQALLAISLITSALFVFIGASPIEAVIVVAVVILPAGALFWFLIRAMARIQMPERR